MRLQYPRQPTKKAVQKWAVQEKKRRGGRLRAHPEVLLQFLSGRRNFIANVYLYHKVRDKEPYTKEVVTANGVGPLILALETILDEWARLK